ncbi:MAG TPA: acyltransferase [Candidatus Sulfotelmatobacter sp.]|nr:acyltransferase [Candidatus Sulfotelmatobacter sp.]
MAQAANRSNHIDFLDQVRGIAILSVFLVHAFGQSFGVAVLPWNGWHAGFGAPKLFLLLLPLSYGFAGVSIFFVVSGFCIHLSFHQHPDWRAFFIRRFFRIYPPYLFALLLFAIFLPWTRVGHTFAHQVFQIGLHAMLLHNFSSATLGSINPNFWSIAVEVQLYLMYPLLIWGVSRWGWSKFLACLAVMEFGLRGFLRFLPALTGTHTDNWWQGIPVVYAWLTGFPLIYWFSWAIGAALADAYLAGRPLPFARHSLLGWGAPACGSFLIKDFACFTFTLFAVFTATGIAALLQRNYFQQLPKLFSEPLRLVGICSYSMYLIHFPFLSLAPRVAGLLFATGRVTPLEIFVTGLGFLFPIFLLSAVWYRLFEIPSIMFGKKLVRRFLAGQKTLAHLAETRGRLRAWQELQP